MLFKGLFLFVFLLAFAVHAQNNPARLQRLIKTIDSSQKYYLQDNYFNPGDLNSTGDFLSEYHAKRGRPVQTISGANLLKLCLPVFDATSSSVDIGYCSIELNGKSHKVPVILEKNGKASIIKHPSEIKPQAPKATASISPAPISLAPAPAPLASKPAQFFSKALAPKNICPPVGQIQKAITSARDIFRVTALPQGTSSDFSTTCASFIDRKGNYGSLGKRLRKELSSETYQKFTEDSTYNIEGLKQLCPNFKDMNKEERIQFWIWTFTAIAQVESSCGRNNKAQGVHTTAAGMFMLNAPYNNRRSRAVSLRTKMRKRDSYNYCLPKDIFPPLDNTLCALDIMTGHLVGQYGNPKLMSENETGYWQELNQGIDGKIPELIKELKICGH